MLCLVLALLMVALEDPAQMLITGVAAFLALGPVGASLYCSASMQAVSQRHSSAWMLIAAGAIMRLVAGMTEVLYLPHVSPAEAASLADIPRFLSGIPIGMAVLRMGENRQEAAASWRSLAEAVIVGFAVSSVYLALDADTIARFTASQPLHVAAIIGRPGVGAVLVWLAFLALLRERTPEFRRAIGLLLIFCILVVFAWFARIDSAYAHETAAFFAACMTIGFAARASRDAVGRNAGAIRPRYWHGLNMPWWQQYMPQIGMYLSMFAVAASAFSISYGYGHAPHFAERGILICLAGVVVLVGIVYANEAVQGRRLRSNLTRLLMTTSRLVDASTPRDAIPRAVHELRQLVVCKSIAVYLVRKDGGYIRLNFTDISKAPTESSAHMLSAPYAGALKDAAVVFGTHETGDAEMIIPMRTANETLGLVVLTGAPGHAYSAEQADLAEALTSQLALSIDSFRLRRAAADTAITDERNRLARELHDSVSQALFSIALGSRTARELVERKESPADTLDYVVSLAEVALAEMRALVFELRPESMMQFGLLVALRGQLESLCERNHMTARIEIRCAEPEQSPPALKETIYRICMEAANNAVKHARATELALTIDAAGGHLQIELRDNGRGFDASGEFPGHLGLISMRERAQRQGGHLEIKSQVGHGTAVRMQMPLVETSSELLR